LILETITETNISYSFLALYPAPFVSLLLVAFIAENFIFNPAILLSPFGSSF